MEEKKKKHERNPREQEETRLEGADPSEQSPDQEGGESRAASLMAKAYAILEEAGDRQLKELLPAAHLMQQAARDFESQGAAFEKRAESLRNAGQQPKTPPGGCAPEPFRPAPEADKGDSAQKDGGEPRFPSGPEEAGRAQPEECEDALRRKANEAKRKAVRLDDEAAQLKQRVADLLTEEAVREIAEAGSLKKEARKLREREGATAAADDLAAAANMARVGIAELLGAQAMQAKAGTARSPLVLQQPVAIQHQRALQGPPTNDVALWVVIRNSTNALGFQSYSNYIDGILCGRPQLLPAGGQRVVQKSLPFPDVEPYRVLKVATEVFMMANAGVLLPNFDFAGIDANEETTRLQDGMMTPASLDRLWKQYLMAVNGTQTIPYLQIIRQRLSGVPLSAAGGANAYGLNCYAILRERLTRPSLLELIWSYWHEEGMLVQTMNTISWRFQNRRGPVERDPLAMVEIDPLRPLNNLLWGYIQDEQHRLTVPRRAYEYDHHYGITIRGKAVPQVRAADPRSRFLDAFHHLLQVCTVFFKEDDDTTVVADGFPVLNALREVHLLLSQGAHNQYGDLPWTARQEMLMQEWLLARPEFREFLPRRIMVDYPEPWMDSVETMKTLQGWTDASVLHFRDLGIFGEQVLLSVRFGAWTSVINPVQAAYWARYWRPEIQGYIHAYRAVAGVDLTDTVDATQPSVLLSRRLAGQRAAVR